MTVAGEGRRPGRHHVMELAKLSGIERREAVAIVEEVSGAGESWADLARAGDIARATRLEIENALQRGREALLGASDGAETLKGSASEAAEPSEGRGSAFPCAGEASIHGSLGRSPMSSAPLSVSLRPHS